MTSFIQLLRQMRAKLASHPPHTGQPTLIAPRLPSRPDGLNYQDMFDPLHYLTFHIPVYVGAAIGDGIVLYWDNIEIGSAVFNIDHQVLGVVTIQVFPLNIPLGQGRQSWLDTVQTYPVHYHVERSSSNQTFSFDATVLVKTTIPGGVDPEPATPYTNENLALPLGIPASIDITSPPQPLVVTIPMWHNAHEGDLATLHWNGHRIAHAPLTAAEASGASITITVPWSVIVQNLGDNLIVRYDVRDVVNNWSLFSRDTRVNVEDGSLLLFAPEIDDAVGGVLDLDVLAGKHPKVYIPANRGVIALGTEVTIIWTGTTAQGSSRPHTQTHVVSGNEDSRGFEVVVPNSEAAPLSGGHVRVVYEALVNGQQRRSRTAEASVVGNPLDLALPEVEHVTGTTLQLATVGSGPVGITVRAYSAMEIGDTLYVYWHGTTSRGSNVDHSVQVNIDNTHVGLPVVVAVPNEYAVVLAGSSDLRVSYRVVTKEQVQHDSPVLTLNVSIVGGTLPAPWFKDFPNAVIDPGLVVGSTHIMVGNYPGKRIDDDICVSVVGDQKWVTLCYPVHDGNLNDDIAFTLAKDPYIDANTRLEVSYQVTHADGSRGGSETLAARIEAGSTLPWPAPKVKDATGNEVTTLNPIKPGTSNEENTATLTVTDARLKVGNVLAGLWTVAGAQASYVPWVTVSIDGQVQAPVPREFVAAALGKQVVVEYVVFGDSGGEAIGISVPMTLTVLAIAQGALPQPDITEAGGTNILNVSRLTGDATATVAAWPFIDTAQRYWLEARGTLANGSSDSIQLASDLPVASVSGVARPIPLARLQALKHASTLTLVMKVAFTGNSSNVVTFPLRDFTVQVVPDVVTTIPYVVEADPISATPTSATLNLMKPLQSAVLIIPHYGGMNRGDEVTVHWEGTVGGGSFVESRTVAEVVDMRFVVPRDIIYANGNRDVSIYYVVQKASGESVSSGIYTLSVFNPTINGTCDWHASERTASFDCTLPVQNVVVPASLPIGARIAITNTVAPNHYLAVVNAPDTTAVFENQMGSQPIHGATVAATPIPGVGVVFYQLDSPVSWRLNTYSGPGSNWEQTGALEFVKTGVITPGTINPGAIVSWYMGLNRLHYMDWTLLNALTVQVTE